MHSSGKTPLIRLAKRDGMAGAGQWGIRIAAILLALVVGGLVILLSGNNPIQGYAIIVEGALGKTSGIRQTVKNFIPLLGTALAIAPCFKMRFWNIGAEGQITAGAMCATYFALFWADSIPQVPLLLLMCAAGPLGDQRDSVHPDDELHHHRRGEVAPGRPVGEDPPGQPAD